MENQESEVNTEATTADEINMDPIDNTESGDIYEVQPRRNKALKSLALNILKSLPEDILREEPDFSSIKSNVSIPDCEACQECDKPVLTEDLPRSLVLNVCGDMIHRTCANKPDKRGVLLCSCGVADDKDPLLGVSNETVDGDVDMDEVNNEDGGVESTRPDDSSRKRTSTSTEESSSKKKKTSDKDDGSAMLKKLIKELKDDTPPPGPTFASQPPEDSYTYLYKEIADAETDNDIASQRVLLCYFQFGKKIFERMDYYKNEKKYRDRMVNTKVDKEIKEQLPKEVNDTTRWKQTERA